MNRARWVAMCPTLPLGACGGGTAVRSRPLSVNTKTSYGAISP